jgi:hypothetical protein
MSTEGQNTTSSQHDAKLPVMRWVAVSERTPETNVLCLCATEYGYSFRYWKGNHFEGEHIANEPKVTHWMYAPEPPCV